MHYGIETHRDGGVAFAGPAVNVGYPRWWEPQTAPWTKPRGDSLTGDFTDNFGHPLTVLAVKNPAKQPPQDDVMQLMELKASGLGLVRFDKRQRTTVIECWPYLADVTKKGTQFPGWPAIVRQLDNYGRATVAHLPKLKFTGVKKPRRAGDRGAVGRTHLCAARERAGISAARLRAGELHRKGRRPGHGQVDRTEVPPRERRQPGHRYGQRVSAGRAGLSAGACLRCADEQSAPLVCRARTGPPVV